MVNLYRGQTPRLLGSDPIRIFLLLVLLTPVAFAEDGLKLRPGMTGVADLGAIDCATFNEMYPNGPTGMRQAALYYAEGYIFARTGEGIDALLAAQPADAAWDFDSLTDVIVGHCAVNPQDPVSSAVAALAASLGV